jgi:hypothetical protein
VAGSITLSYTDADSDKASACTLSSLSNLTGTCSCNATTGVCTASVTGTSNYNGSASFSYTVTANSVVSNSASASVTVTAVNDAPVLGAISAQTMTEGNSLTVTLSVSDVDNSITCGSFITATSSNTTLLPNANIVKGGSAPGCTLTITPATSQTGSATVTVTASDGALSASQSFSLTVNPNTVTISQYTGYRGWGNNTLARTCYEYRYPTAPYQYSGVTGDGIYRIDPDGAGSIAALNVTCDMTNGGWTSLSAFSTTSTGYSRNGTLTSNDLVTSNSAAYTAIANLSTQQTVNYSVNFNGGSTLYSCPYLGGQTLTRSYNQDYCYYWYPYYNDYLMTYRCSDVSHNGDCRWNYYDNGYGTEQEWVCTGQYAYSATVTEPISPCGGIGGWVTVNSAGTTSPQSSPFDCHLGVSYVDYNASFGFECSGYWSFYYYYDWNTPCNGNYYCTYRTDPYIKGTEFCNSNGYLSYQANATWDSHWGGCGATDYCIGVNVTRQVSKNLSGGSCPANNSRADLVTSISTDCSLTVRFLNSGTTVIHTPISAQTTANSTSTSATFSINGSGGVRKIQTQTTCTGSGGTPSNGASFTNATVRFKTGAYETVSLSSYNTLKANFIDCGQSQQPFSAKVTDCAQLNNGATVDVGGGKIWKLVTKIGANELWMDDATGIVWSPYQGSMNWNNGVSRCQNLHTTAPNSNYGISGETWSLPSKTQTDSARLNGVRSLLSQGSNWWTSTEYNAGNAWFFRATHNEFDIVGKQYTCCSYSSEFGVPCVFSSRD